MSRIVRRVAGEETETTILPIAVPETEQVPQKITKRQAKSNLLGDVPFSIANPSSKIVRRMYDPKTGFKNPSAIYEELRKEDKTLTLKEVQDVAAKQEFMQINKKPPAPTQTAFIPITAPPWCYQADLIFYLSYGSYNSGYIAVLTLIEMTSRKAYAKKLKNKEGASVAAAFAEMLTELPAPMIRLETDNGSEFIAKEFQEVVKNNGIEHRFKQVGDHTSLGIMNRFHLTLKTMINNYCVAYNTVRFMDKLDDFVFNYNNTIHRTIGMKPADVKLSDMERIRAAIISKKNTIVKDIFSDFKPGLHVRVLLPRSKFDKGATQRYSREVYKIAGRRGNAIEVQDAAGYLMPKLFKPHELQIITEVEAVVEPAENAIKAAEIEAASIRQVQKEGIDVAASVPKGALLEDRAEKTKRALRELAKLTIAGTEKLSEVNSQRWYKSFKNQSASYTAPTTRILRSSRS